jgi:hypothetical protein
MRKELAEKLLDSELELCAEDPRLQGDGIRIHRVGTDVFAAFATGRGGRAGVFRLDCAAYDASPPGVAMVDPKTGEELSQAKWTPGVPHSLHPVTGKPFVCIQGTAEYHTHPSHVDDSWDRYRARFRLRQTIRRLLEKAGAI